MTKRPKMSKEEQAERKHAKREALIALGLAKPPREANPNSVSLSIDQRRLVNLFYGTWAYMPPVSTKRIHLEFDLPEDASHPRALVALIRREMVMYWRGGSPGGNRIAYAEGWYLTDKGVHAHRMRHNWYTSLWNGRNPVITFTDAY